MSCTSWIILHHLYPMSGTYSVVDNQCEGGAVELAKEHAQRRECESVILCKFEPVYKVKVETTVNYDERYYRGES
jgi:hypothetical protein